MRRFRRSRSKAPLAIAGLLSVPLYLASLLASSLALDTPRILHGRENPPGSGTEATIWLAALVAPGILLAIGLVGLAVRRISFYGAAAAGVAICVLLPRVSHGWIARHTERFPLGMDFLKDSDPSNLSSKGEWEQAAQATIVSITHWTLIIAVSAIVVGVLLELRRRRSSETSARPSSQAVAIAGAPEVSPATEISDREP
ncbi:MAG TPA: hypothetical protein VGM99_04285 [Candidatus Cybelea sp.]